MACVTHNIHMEKLIIKYIILYNHLKEYILLKIINYKFKNYLNGLSCVFRVKDIIAKITNFKCQFKKL